MRSLASVLMKICSIFTTIIVQCSDFEELKKTVGSVGVKNSQGFKISRFPQSMSLFTED